MTCADCGRSNVDERVTFYRANPKGEKAIWKCFDCLTLKQRKELDPDMVKLCQVIQRAQPEGVE